MTVPDAVNAELAPWLKLTFPADSLVGLSGPPLKTSRRVSWLLALGVFPLERLVYSLDEVGHRRMVQSAHGFVQRLWRHERRVEERPSGCAVRDIVTIELRMALTRPLTMTLVRALFRHRHKRLRLLYS